MKETPILFSAPMVRALLAGMKTQTRRTVSPRNSFFGSAHKEFWDHADFTKAWPDGGDGGAQYLHVPCHVENEGECAVCDHWGWPGTAHRLWSRIAPPTDGRIIYATTKAEQREAPASRLWVRETWSFGHFEGGEPARLVYAADWQPEHEDDAWEMKWKPSIHMPRSASRLTLDVAEVRVQQLQSISEADAVAEGCKSKILYGTGWYRHLWESLYGAGSWGNNPWVWPITFRAVIQMTDREAAQMLWLELKSCSDNFNMTRLALPADIRGDIRDLVETSRKVLKLTERNVA